MTYSTSQSTEKPTAYMTGKDMFLLPDGSTYHLGVKAGDLFPRILTVGSHGRAKAISTLFDQDKPTKVLASSREFHVFSGYFNGVGVSIIAIGMGAPMMDFMVREATFVQPGPMAIIRLGTCGIFNKELPPGTILTAGKGSMYVYVNYAHFNGCANDPKIDQSSPPYLMCKPVPCHLPLNALLTEELKANNLSSYDGLNACGETFYSCQAREDARFDDRNAGLLDTIIKQRVDFMEMETHQLFHLAQLRRDKCYTAAAAIGIVNRTSPEMTQNITADMLHQAELDAGRACLAALTRFQF